MMMKTAIVRAFRIVFPEINLPYSSEELLGKEIHNITEKDFEKLKQLKQKQKKKKKKIN